MSRTDKTMPWRILEEERPEYPWFKILNSRMNAWGRREIRRYWHSERNRVRTALRQGDYQGYFAEDDPAPSRTRHGVRWEMM